MSGLLWQVQQTELSLEQALGHHTHLTVTYMGSKGSRLPTFIDRNIDLASAGTITYTVDGKQFVALAVGPNVLAFSLP